MAEAGPSRAPRATPASTSAHAASSPSDPPPAFERWRKSISHFTGLGLSEEEQAQRTQQQDDSVIERDFNRCEKWKASLMESSPIVVFMLKHLSLSGCTFPQSSIQCHSCPEDRSGGFAPDFGILLCQNRFFSKKHMEDTMAHELIHAWDHCKFNVDWRDLRHHACTEIRAANLSGDCRWGRELQRGYFAFSKQHQACVKRRAILSVIENPSCANRAMAEKAVNEVWESCSKDTRPFDEVY